MSNPYKFEDNSVAKDVGEYIIYKKPLGRGKCGEVFLGKSKKLNIKVAVKQSKHNGIQNEELLKEIINSREIQVMQRVKSENLVGFYDFKVSQNYIYLFIEYCDGGTLTEFMKKNPNISDEQIVDIFQQIAKGFQALVKENVIHRDLKPDNILLHQNVIKIADFGFARFIEGNPEKAGLYTLKGTPLYVPPQIFDDKKYSNQFDIWSFGCILYELAFGRNIHQSILDLGQLKIRLGSFKNQKVQFPKNNRNPKIIQMISRMLEYYEENRITWPQIFESDMFLKQPKQFLEIENEIQIKDNNQYQEKLQNLQIFTKLSEQFEKINYDHFFLLKWKCILFYFWKFFLENFRQKINEQNTQCFQVNQKNGKIRSYKDCTTMNDLLAKYIDDLKVEVQKQLQLYCIITKQWIEKPRNLSNKISNFEELSLMSNIEKCDNKQLLFFVEKYCLCTFTNEIDLNIKQMIKIIKDELA
ncbi:unnamed protein product [Paramecium primaurelia]|uniref:Protein kinase domain-containing protein n=1 Tax=Paramecium primaurelia TaxID=5886 RepID=A0A8S1M2T4_PARPR|nr:unnamed protein product [Paramecium primaurelia]